jgi:hypothetical protein
LAPATFVVSYRRKQVMPTVKLVEEDCPHPVVRRVFADIKETKKIDRVPAIWRALASHPEHLELCWTQVVLFIP